MNEEVAKFSFFRSFWEGMQDLEDEERLALYDAMTLYAFTGREPEFKSAMRALWKFAKPNIDSSVKGQSTGAKGGRPKNENPPLKPPVKTTPKTDMDMDRDMDRDRDEEMDALEIDPSDRSISNASASGDAAAAGAAPPAAKGGLLRCPMDDCDGYLLPDAKIGKLRCNKCRSTFTASEAGADPHAGKRMACPLCHGDVDETLGGRYACRVCGTESKEPAWIEEGR